MSTNLLTLNQLLDLQKQWKIPSIDQISLQILQEYFEQFILPYKYIFTCINNLTIEVNIRPEEFCHLLFGTIDKSLPYANYYKGINGYNKIKDKTITIGSMNKKVLKNAKYRIIYFIYLNILLDNPKIIYFNQTIVPIGKIHFATTRIFADFLLYRVIADKNIHLFLKNRDDTHIVSVSYFPDSDKTYIVNQIPLKIIKSEKVKISS